MVNWYEITSEALSGFWASFINFIPNLIIAIIVFLIGWLVAAIIGKIISQILIRLQFNRLFEKASWREALEKAEIKVNPAEFIGAIFKWIIVIMVLLVSVQILLGIEEVNPFRTLLDGFIAWIPDFIIAIVIFIVAVIVADLLDKVVVVSVKRIGVEYVGILGLIIRWAIYILAGIAILGQLGVATTLINTLVISFFGTFALAFGLAFGLGGKDAAAKLIEDVRKKISEK